MCYEREKNLGSIPVLHKQTQPEDAMFTFKEVPFSHHKFISRGKELPTYNTDKCCSTESVHFPPEIVLLSVNFRSTFHSFQFWHLIELTKSFFLKWGVKGHGGTWFFCPMGLRNIYLYASFCLYLALWFWANNSILIPYTMVSLF